MHGASAGRSPKKSGGPQATPGVISRGRGDSDETARGRAPADALGTISEMPERQGPAGSPSSPVPDSGERGHCHGGGEPRPAAPQSFPGSDAPPTSVTDSGGTAWSPSPAPSTSPDFAPPKSDKITAEQEDALSADEGIQTSPPFERDEPAWDLLAEFQPMPGGSGEASTAATGPAETPRRYSMSALSQLQQRSPRRLAEADGEPEAASPRSPAKTRLAEEIKARRWRYRPKSCSLESLPHLDWLKQRTESTLDRSAEMQRRTAELIQNAKIAREQEV